MIVSILVPLDGSALAEKALPQAVALAGRFGAALHLVTVHPPLTLYSPVDDPVAAMAEVDREARAAEAEYLRRQAERIAADSGIAVNDAVLDGEPARELARYVSGQQIDLVVMTTHGRGGVSRLWLGSVADRLVRQTERPVLLLRPDTPPNAALFERILVPLDGSVRAETALAAARELMQPSRGKIHLLFVVQPPFIFTPPPPRKWTGPESEPIQRRQLHAYRYLRRLSGPERDPGQHIAAQAVVAYDVANEIIAYAEEYRVGLIALATRGRSGLARWAMGSVADKVLRGGSVPVLVCHGAEDGDAASADYVAAQE